MSVGSDVRGGREVLDHLTIDQDARSRRTLDQPGVAKLRSPGTVAREGGGRTRIEEVAPHVPERSSIGGAGFDSCRMRSSAATASSQSSPRQEPIAAIAFRNVSSERALASPSSSAKTCVTSRPFSDTRIPTRD